jgi:hypothetical protein
MRRLADGEDRAGQSSRQDDQRWQGARRFWAALCRAAGGRSALEGAAAAGKVEGRARCDQVRRALRADSVFDDMVFQDAGPSEDCLYLNVLRPPMQGKQSKLPVMFWIHGGGYSGGGSFGAAAQRRLSADQGRGAGHDQLPAGRLRLSGHEDLAKEANGAAGNYGLMDMVAALQWVKANIAKFGGDPGQCDDLRRERRLVRGEHADGVAHGAGAVCKRPSARAARLLNGGSHGPEALAARKRSRPGRNRWARQIAGGAARFAGGQRFLRRSRKGRAEFPGHRWPLADRADVPKPTPQGNRRTCRCWPAGIATRATSIRVGMTAEKWKALRRRHSAITPASS